MSRLDVRAAVPDRIRNIGLGPTIGKHVTRGAVIHAALIQIPTLLGRVFPR